MTVNHMVMHWARTLKEGLHPIFVIVLDDSLFLGFLGLLVANGIVIDHLGWDGGYNLDKIQLLSYNSMAWIICGYVTNGRVAWLEMASD